MVEKNTQDRIPSCIGDRATHFFSQTDKKPPRKAFLDKVLVRLVVEALELVVPFIDIIIFIQDNILMSIRYHHLDDIVIRYWELNFLQGIIQNIE